MRLVSLLTLLVIFLSVSTGQAPNDNGVTTEPPSLPPGVTSQPPETSPPTTAPTPLPITTPPPTPPPPTAPPTTAPPTHPPTTPPPTPAPVTTAPPTKAPENTTSTYIEPIVPSPDPTTRRNPIQKQTESSSDGFPAVATFGIVMVCIALIGIIAFFVYRQRHAPREDSKDFDASPIANTVPFSHFDEDREDQNVFMMEARAESSPTGSPVHKSDSPDFATKPPRQSSPHFSPEVPMGDFERTINVTNNKSPFVSSLKDGRVSETESHESYAESYTDGYRGTSDAFQSFDGNEIGRETFRSTLEEETRESTQTGSLSAGEGHWMGAMDDLRATNDSYAMLEDGAGSYGSGRGSGMRFSTESDFT